MCNKKCNGENMRENTYIKIGALYSRYRGYVGTQDLLSEGFSNRQISVLVEEGYLEKICHGHYWIAGRQYRKPSDYKIPTEKPHMMHPINPKIGIADRPAKR